MSLAVTGAPTLSPSPALSETTRVAVADAKVGASFTLATVMETVAVLDSDGLPASLTW